MTSLVTTTANCPCCHVDHGNGEDCSGCHGDYHGNHDSPGRVAEIFVGVFDRGIDDTNDTVVILPVIAHLGKPLEVVLRRHI